MSHSQQQEEEHILAYFGDFKGRLLDIGAADGKHLSNTYQLLKNGWSGVLVEPSAHLIPALQKHTEGLDVELINSVISTEAGWSEWYESNGDFLSTTDAAHVAKWRDVPFRKIWTYRVHFMAIISKFGNDFDFINIDTEATSAALFLEMFDKFPHTRLWCIEHDSRKKEILAKAQGFREIYYNGENIIIGR